MTTKMTENVCRLTRFEGAIVVGLQRQQRNCDIALPVAESDHNVLVKRKGQ
jgi:hypothetical protein